MIPRIQSRRSLRTCRTGTTCKASTRPRPHQPVQPCRTRTCWRRSPCTGPGRTVRTWRLWCRRPRHQTCRAGTRCSHQLGRPRRKTQPRTMCTRFPGPGPDWMAWLVNERVLTGRHVRTECMHFVYQVHVVLLVPVSTVHPYIHDIRRKASRGVPCPLCRLRSRHTRSELTDRRTARAGTRRRFQHCQMLKRIQHYNSYTALRRCCLRPPCRLHTTGICRGRLERSTSLLHRRHTVC